VAPTADVVRPRRSHKLRVRSLLLLVVLIPTLGMTAMAATTAKTALDRRDAARSVRSKADALAGIIDARLAIAGEQTQSSVTSIASDLGTSVETLGSLYGVDYAAEMRAARKVVDSDQVFETMPELADDRLRLQALRLEIDAGTATFDQVRDVFAGLTDTLDGVWRRRLVSLQSELAAGDLPGSLDARANDLLPAFDLLSWGGRAASAAVELVREGPDQLRLARLLDAQSRERGARDLLSTGLGPRAKAAWARQLADPAAQRFEQTLANIAASNLIGAASPLADPAAFGKAFNDGTPWAEGLSRVVRAAANDLRVEAARQEHNAGVALRNQVAVAVALTALALTAALLLAGSVTRPIRRLQLAAHQIHAGRFDLDPIPTNGPRELSATAAAFNEMATTLAAVESHAVALADDPDAPILNDALPGRTGRALQVALNRLRASMRGSEQHRLELEVAATHDGLTGLLNRSAALVMIERDLAAAARVGGRVMALFVDLDGLKPINDRYGHAAGDDALRLTADALRACTRQSDVIARLGGDEFLVASVSGDREQVQILAERIRTAVAAQQLFGPAGRIPLHCSIGMALSGPDVTTVDALIKRADSALYRAKRRGRDQVAWAEPNTGDPAGLQAH
jgi:diguanylate cyclase (GGDEF)-like protein